MTTVTDTTPLTAASQLAALLPATVPLTAVPAEPGQGPRPDETAVAASFVGAVSADVVVVAEDAVAEALAGGAVTLADAVRPALEAASAAFGAGVLDAARTLPAAEAFGEGVQVFALTAGDTVQGWFGVRVRVPDVPGPRRPEAGAPAGAGEGGASLRVLYDVEMTLTAEIGRTRLPVRHVLDLVPGSVIELDRAAGAPADLMVNGRLIARGEVVVVDEDYGLRITEIIAPEPAL